MASARDRLLDLASRVQREAIDERTFDAEIDEIAKQIKGPLLGRRLVHVRRYASGFYAAAADKPSIRDYAKTSLLLALKKLGRPL